MSGDEETRNSVLRLARTAALWQLVVLPASLVHHFLWISGRAPYVNSVVWLLVMTSMLGMAGCLLRADRALRQGSDATSTVLKGGLLLCLVAVIPTPVLSEDVFSYLGRGRLLVVHHVNPYTEVARPYVGIDPMLESMKHWADHTLPYGPVGALYQGAIAWVTDLPSFLPWQVRMWLGVYLFKLVSVLGLYCTGVVLLRLIPGDSEIRRDRLLLWFLWNPALLLETGVNGHNDSLMVLPLCLAIDAARRTRFGSSAVAVAVSALVKFTTLFVAPLFFVLAWRVHSLLRFSRGAAVGIALFAVAWLLFWSDSGLGFVVQRLDKTNASLQTLLCMLLGGDASRAVTVAGVLLAGIVLMVRSARLRTAAELPASCMVSMMAVVVFALPFSGPWFALWWAPFAVLAGKRHALCLLIFAVTAAPSYSVYLLTRRYPPSHGWVQWALAVVLPALPLLPLRVPWLQRLTSRL